MAKTIYTAEAHVTGGREHGHGVTGRLALRRIAIGSRALMGELGIDVTALAARADELRGQGDAATVE